MHIWAYGYYEVLVLQHPHLIDPFLSLFLKILGSFELRILQQPMPSF